MPMSAGARNRLPRATTQAAARVRAALWAFSLGAAFAPGPAVVSAAEVIGNLGQPAASKTLETLRQRAEAGDPKWQVRLGDIYDRGDGVAIDPAEAAKWYSRAAELGHPSGQVKLARLYRVGRGLELDRVAALRWLTIASALGEHGKDVRTERESVTRELTPEEVTRAEAQAREWVERFNRAKPRRAGERGLVMPRVVREVRPDYTRDAMDRQIHGMVLVEAVVLPDGSVGAARIVRSLDQQFGLDEEALKAARQWRFVPGKKDGVPVAVLVTIELDFVLK